MNRDKYIKVQFSSKIQINPTIDWCEKNIGRRGTCWEVKFKWNPANFGQIGNYGTFEFVRGEDALFFALKWL